MTFRPDVEEKKGKAALYVRVSTMHQIDKDSLPFQKEELINYAKYVLGIEDYVIFEDAGYSAKNTDRPEYQKMMKRMRKGEFTHLLVFKIDRISRNLKDFTTMYDELKEMKVTFISKVEQFDTSSAMGEAMLKIILVFAELERKLAAERVYGIMLSRAEKGLWNGATVPYGFVYCEETEYPVAHEDEVKGVQYIYNLYEKVSSTIEVAHRLNEENVLTKRGGRWTAKTVRDILRNPFYIGTYRYNMRESSGSTYYKDESEWIVKENNHPAVIEEAQFKRVNAMLSANFKGDNGTMRRDVHTHLFGMMMYCQKCGSLLFAGLDSARKDGYRPSRYTCSTNKKVRNTKSCNSFVSDIRVAPFVFNYISNLLRFQYRYVHSHSKRDIERALLRGSPFVDVLGIADDSLAETVSFFKSGYERKSFKQSDGSAPLELPDEIGKVEREKEKFEKALKRLDDLYLYDDTEMSQKDYVLKKREINGKLEEVSDRLESLKLEDSQPTESFIDKAAYFLITQELMRARDVDYRRLLDTIGVELLEEFLESVIDRIEVSDKLIRSITFKNGVTHNFVWKEEKKQKNRVSQRGAYQEYFGEVINYIKENGSINRVEVEKLTNLRRSSASSLLLSLENKGTLERRGNSVAIRFFMKDNINE